MAGFVGSQNRGCLEQIIGWRLFGILFKRARRIKTVARRSYLALQSIGNAVGKDGREGEIIFTETANCSHMPSF
jgi:hypothetical protein